MRQWTVDSNRWLVGSKHLIDNTYPLTLLDIQRPNARTPTLPTYSIHLLHPPTLNTYSDPLTNIRVIRVIRGSTPPRRRYSITTTITITITNTNFYPKSSLKPEH